MIRTNEDKLELFADLIEPAAKLLTDPDWLRLWQTGDRFAAIRAAIKGHKKEIVEILARIDGKTPEHYTIDGVALFIRLAAMFNRPDMDDTVAGLFTSQAQSAAPASSGPATATTGEGAT